MSGVESCPFCQLVFKEDKNKWSPTNIQRHITCCGKESKKVVQPSKRKILSITSFFAPKSKKILTTSECEATCSTSDQSTSIVP